MEREKKIKEQILDQILSEAYRRLQTEDDCYNQLMLEALVECIVYYKMKPAQ